MPARMLLDQVHSIARVEELAGAPGRYADELAAELPAGSERADLEARDVELAAALAHIDTTITRIMKIRLEHALADDSSIPPPTRNVFVSTLGKYAHDLPLLAERVRDVAARGRSPDPGGVASRVVDVASRTLALRAALRAGVLELVRSHAAASLPDVDRKAKDRRADDKDRTYWSAVRRDLEALVANPEHVMTAPMPDRVKALPDQLDELPAEPEVSFADMIEMD